MCVRMDEIKAANRGQLETKEFLIISYWNLYRSNEIGGFVSETAKKELRQLIPQVKNLRNFCK